MRCVWWMWVFVLGVVEPALGRDLDQDLVSRQVLVRLADGVKVAAQDRWVREGFVESVEWLAARGERPIGLLGAMGGGRVADRLVLVTVKEGWGLHEAAEILGADPAVQYVEPNSWIRLAVVPDDFEFEFQWALQNGGAQGGEPGADIRVADAWEMTQGSREVRVAVIDTGVDFFHPDLAANIWHNRNEVAGNGRDDDGNGYVDDVTGYDFVGRDGDAMDDHGHGTHVAGILGAVGNNGIGISGVCWEVELMAVKAFDSQGRGTVAGAIQALEYAHDNGARIINASWGWAGKSRAMEEVIGELSADGVLVVAAAGNDNRSDLFFPAGFDLVMAVAATDHLDKRATFSNYGAHIDLAAPGKDVLSTLPGNAYGRKSGTSMAAPHASGVAALIWSRHPEFSAGEVRRILAMRTDPLTTDRAVGQGRLNAARAVEVSRPLPVAELDLPEGWWGEVEVAGVAAGPAVTGYKVWLEGEDGSRERVLLGEGNGSAEGGTLLAGVDVSGFGDGRYEVVLEVLDSDGQKVVARGGVEIDNVAMTSPAGNDIRALGERIELRGRLVGEWEWHRLEVGLGSLPEIWWDTGIEMAAIPAGEGEGVLGWWRTEGLEEDRFYTVKLTAGNAAGEEVEERVPMIHLGAHLKAGWPIAIPVEGEFVTDDWRQIVPVDLEGDGKVELALVDQGSPLGSPARLMVFDAEGALLWERPLGSGAPFADVPVTGDLDGDGMKEVIVDAGEEGVVRVFAADGREWDGNWPLRLGEGNQAKTTGDLDGDGRDELICLGLDSQYEEDEDREVVYLRVLNGDAVELAKWAISWCRMEVRSMEWQPVVADLDGDGSAEILARTECSKLSLFSLNWPDGPVWSADVGGPLAGRPVAGDLDGDGLMEVVQGAAAAGQPLQGGLYVFDAFGRLQPGFPVLREESISSQPALVDFEGKGRLSAVVVTDRRWLHVVDERGFERVGWPVEAAATATTTPAIADVNGDGVWDIVAASPGQLIMPMRYGRFNGAGGILAWEADGTRIDLNADERMSGLFMEGGGPTDINKAGWLVAGDLDGNGLLDLVAASQDDRDYFREGTFGKRKGRSSLYRWELAVPYPPRGLEGLPQEGSSGSGVYVKPRSPNLAPRILPAGLQVIQRGERFEVMDLNAQGEDEDHAVGELEWSVEGGVELEVELLEGSRLSVAPRDPSWVGTESVLVRVQDPAGGKDEQWIAYEVRPELKRPVGREDFYRIREDESQWMEVLANDAAAEGGRLQIGGVSRPEHGRVEMEGDRLYFSPGKDFYGKDSFTYTLREAGGGSQVVAVRVNVMEENDPPQAQLDQLATFEDTAREVDVLANDWDVDGDAIFLVHLSQPEHGWVEVVTGGVVRYMPEENYAGLDRFQYRIRDGRGLERTGMVAVRVTPVNDAPQARSEEKVVTRNGRLNVAFAAEDADGDRVKYRLEQAPEHGALYIYPRVAEYYPHEGFTGKDSFSYRAEDGKGGSSVGLISIVVIEGNNVPKAARQSLRMKPGRELMIQLEGEDRDDDELIFEVVSGPEHGRLSGEDARRSYRPEEGFVGLDSLEFRVSDGESWSERAKVAIEVTDVNSPPRGQAETVEVVPGGAIEVALKAVDGENDPLTFEITAEPRQGALFGAGRSWLYVPEAGFEGPDRVEWRVHDGEVWSERVRLTFLVRRSNEVPVVADVSVQTDPGAVVAVELEIRDADDDTFRTVVLTGPARGRVWGNGDFWLYEPEAGFIGEDSFTFRVWDGFGYSEVGRAWIRVGAVEPEPVWISGIEVAGEVELELSGVQGKRIRVERSADLLEWELVIEAEVTVPVWRVRDEKKGMAGSWFYRAGVVSVE